MPTHIEGMKYALKLIEELQIKYAACGYEKHDLPIEKVFSDIQNEIGMIAFKDWRIKKC